jgi:hypothetical protein
MPQVTIRRPFSELDLCDQLGSRTTETTTCVKFDGRRNQFNERANTREQTGVFAMTVSQEEHQHWLDRINLCPSTSLPIVVRDSLAQVCPQGHTLHPISALQYFGQGAFVTILLNADVAAPNGGCYRLCSPLSSRVRY